MSSRASQCRKRRAEALAKVQELAAEIGLPPPSALPRLTPSAEPIVWRGCVALWMVDEGEDSDADEEAGSASDDASDSAGGRAGGSADGGASDNASDNAGGSTDGSDGGTSDMSTDIYCVLLLFGPNGTTRTRLLDVNVFVEAAFESGDQLFAIANTEDLYVWRSLHDVSRCFAYGHWENFGPIGLCDCARANTLIHIMTVEEREDAPSIYTNALYIAGVDPCACADTSMHCWRYKHLPELPNTFNGDFVLALNGQLLDHWDSPYQHTDPYDALREIEPGVPTVAPAWAPERHHHHFVLVRALVLQLLIIGRWAPGARLPPALWRRILARTADRASANLRDLIPAVSPVDATA